MKEVLFYTIFISNTILIIFNAYFVITKASDRWQLNLIAMILLIISNCLKIMPLFEKWLRRKIK